MAGRLNRPAATDGVVAYQDYDNPEMFHYFPLRIDSVLGETLRKFEVKYYGINAQPYWVDYGNLVYKSCCGGILKGAAVADMTAAQRANITEEIQKRYNIKKPVLVPIVLDDVTVQPIFAKHIVESGTGGTATFPNQVTLGSQFNYEVGASNSLFAELVGAELATAEPVPEFAVNIYGTASLYADPWVAEIHADLSKVWEYTRSQVKVGANIGWFNLGVDVDKITQELISKGIVTIKYRQGSGSSEFGWQMLNSTKAMFEAINKQITSGEGLFKFEPNPTPQEPSKDDNWAAKLLPFTVNVNTSYISNFFNQEITYDEVVSFEGQLPVLMSSSMSLAIPCGGESSKFFYDLQLKESGCVTKAKSDGLQKRITTEVAAKNKEVLRYLGYVESGKWTPQQFGVMLDLLNTITLTETPSFKGYHDDGTPILELASGEEVREILAALERNVEDGALPTPREPQAQPAKRRIKL
ncbi:hypothetical protein [Amycolatopsis pithecellobii]|uniref:Uncharacterized protein n=1 Tax=Amycolatopsis pithecellobii TaxID=664692 RepID=A0A6N7Z2H0_9PSEU|nr:hypothetical protein [Amycolatopsis pithecellobii]MTD54221.1 hypothetical protein [Amycolatopsis pithecellobii]